MSKAGGLDRVTFTDGPDAHIDRFVDGAGVTSLDFLPRELFGLRFDFDVHSLKIVG